MPAREIRATVRVDMNARGRMQRVQTPIIPVVGELIRQNPGTISLGQGVVHYEPPGKAIEYIQRFLADPNNHKYQMVDGIPELRKLIEEKLRSENGIDLQKDRRLIVTAGGNMAFLNAILAITDPADEIIQIVPYYFNHEMAVTIADCVPVCVASDSDFQPDLKALQQAITKKTRAIVTISPNNPSGAVYSEQMLRQINALCAEQHIYHIHDEAYEYFTYGNATHFSPASAESSKDHTISLYSMSKAYGFASWRIGWMVIPRALNDSVRKIQDTNLICPPVISQWAAAGAMTEGAQYCRSHIQSLEKVRNTVLERLREIEDIVSVIPSAGALYLLLRIKTTVSDMEIVKRLIRDYRVAAIPGSTFGIDDGCYLRISFGALDGESVVDGAGRLTVGLREIVGAN